MRLAHLPARAAGVTLIELILSVVIIGVGLAGIIVVINRNVLSSADPMVQHQAVAIAEAYLEEILTKDFCDPNLDLATQCQIGSAPGTAQCNVCSTPVATVEGNRALFDNVCDYDGRTDVGAQDQTETAITGLGGYTIQIAIVQNATLGGLAGGNCEVLRADVAVSGPAGVSFTLSGYRTNYQ